ncbi:TIGR03016 family PEP-CTERM system-associated outer membrane protein [Rugosibacter aromaticivorans]|nr:TIGR03016 family PEP-CTERM system-associated outer membrane protein [Rugosibacter aromaticivorans]
MMLTGMLANLIFNNRDSAPYEKRLQLAIRTLLFSICTVGIAIAQQVDSTPVDDVSAVMPSAVPAWRIVPSIATDVTYTDNVGLVNTSKKSDLVTRLSPGIVIEGRGGHVTGSLDYRWQEYAYARDSNRNNQQRSLNATGKLELVDQWLYIDGRGSISQQPISVFGTQGVSNDLVNTNRTETSTYQWSPYIQGRLGGVADYTLRYTGARSKAGAGELAAGSGTTSRAWSGRLAGDTSLASLGWSVDLQQQRMERSTARNTQSKRAVGTLEYRIDPQVRLHASLGRESDDYSNTQSQSRTVRGFGGDWAPTERTTVSLSKEKRSFGDSYNADFSHRTALTAWKLSQSRSVNVPADQLINTSLNSAFELLNLQLTSTIPDPVARTQQANLLLQQAGIPADAQAFGTLVTSRVYISRRREASFILTGATNIFTLSADSSDNQALGSGGVIADDFSLSPNIQQSGFTTSWAHKLSPDTAITLNGRRSRNKGSTAGLDTRLTALSLLLTTKLGPKTSATVGLRRTRSNTDSATASSYDEQALTGSLFVTF